MIALDTNVVIRFLVNDDKDQAQRARALIEQHPVLLGPTVLLETEWVLRAAYGFSASQVSGFIKALLGLEQCTTTDPEAIAQALALYDEGMDFADALHLVLAGDARAFATFDKAMIKVAQATGQSVMEP